MKMELGESQRLCLGFWQIYHETVVRMEIWIVIQMMVIEEVPQSEIPGRICGWFVVLKKPPEF